MGRTELAADWRMVQVFLSARQPAIYEVEIDMESGKRWAPARCSCPTFRRTSKCRHTEWIQQQMINHDGQCPVRIHRSAGVANMNHVMGSASAFRDFVIPYGRVEVL